MKKLIIGSLVGGILLFLWQTLSWTVLDVHGKELMKAPNQDSIISYLSNQLPEEGQYMIPTVTNSSSKEEREQYMKDMAGKPRVLVNYTKAVEMNMASNVIRGLLACIIAAFFACWILIKQDSPGFITTLISCILIGVAAYLFFPYTGVIWFNNPGAMTFLTDALISWSLCGLWLGWWLNRGK